MWVWLPPVSVLRSLGRAVSDISPLPDLCPECALFHSSSLPTPSWAVSDISPLPDPDSQCALLDWAVSNISSLPDPNPGTPPLLMLSIFSCFSATGKDTLWVSKSAGFWTRSTRCTWML